MAFLDVIRRRKGSHLGVETFRCLIGTRFYVLWLMLQDTTVRIQGLCPLHGARVLRGGKGKNCTRRDTTSVGSQSPSHNFLILLIFRESQ